MDLNSASDTYLHLCISFRHFELFNRDVCRRTKGYIKSTAMVMVFSPRMISNSYQFIYRIVGALCEL
jgi:hypothetical protein